MKLVLVGNPNSVHVRRYVSDLSKRGHEIHLIGEHQLTKTIPDGCSFFDLTRSFNARKFRYLIWSLKIRYLLRFIQPELVHAIGVSSSGWLASASGYHPFVVTATGSDLLLVKDRSLLHQYLSRWAIRNADHVICPSQPIFDRAVNFGSDPQKTHLLYIGVDYSVFSPGNKTTARKRLNLPDSPIVLSIRPIAPVYRPFDLANAIPIILASVPETRFIMFTYNLDKKTFEAFRKIIRDSNVEHAMIYVGALEKDHEIAMYYQAADLAISIPESDATASSVLEAMACGLPVVATNLPSISAWVTTGRNGALVNVGCAGDIANAVIEILENPIIKDEMGKQASQDVRHRGERSKCLDDLENIYRHMILCG